MTQTVMEQVLDLARWAPSGDNTQPWRFELTGPTSCVIHGFDTRDHVVYDLDGRPSQMALGALIETLGIGASGHGMRADVTLRDGLPETTPTFDVALAVDPATRPSPLIPFITTRCVQRRAMSMRPLTAAQKTELAAAVGGDYELVWFESFAERWRMARLMFRNAKLRLTLREAFEVHRAVIEWDATTSEDRIPDQAVGLDPLALKMMRWAMQDWRRVEFLNTWLAGTVMPRIELDLWPGLACGAHVALVRRAPPAALQDFVAAGRAMQRFWLGCARLGLQLQPQMTPVIFSRYARTGLRFSAESRHLAAARRIRGGFAHEVGAQREERVVFMARVGHGPAADARSTRFGLSRLMR